MKKKIDKYEDLGFKLWDKFDKKLEELGFFIDVSQGRGTLAFNNKDTFVPIIKLLYWYRNLEKIQYDKGYFSIHVEDRNGNKILNGNTVAVYILDITTEEDFDKIEARFDNMLEEVINNYSKYCKENRLDSAYKELKEDRRNF
ncbi:MAG: hypothetical protein K0R54_812 [Clostridiaceae bacterium]|jgi:hypothetical protein|nr:hypothetical protein [Clostridiaceae bacterium]